MQEDLHHRKQEYQQFNKAARPAWNLRAEACTIFDCKKTPELSPKSSSEC